jgi:23S rRNA (cytosine1962-C5)-methyltransferase
MQIITPDFGKDYQLIDSGEFYKLERFGQYILARPEPQAVWPTAMNKEEWNRIAHAGFYREKADKGGEKGEWRREKNMPDQWLINYENGNLNLKMRMGLTSFKHVGIFPEQCDNWNYIYDAVIKMSRPKVLNLFAYTGGASLAALSGGAEVTHVDSVKQVITWSKINMESSGLDGIRWVCEDAVKFVAREARRGNKYKGIILDPPAYGRGPDGEKWQLEDNIAELMSLCKEIFEHSPGSFIVLNLYSMGFSALIANNLLKTYFPAANVDYGELAFIDKASRQLPLGIFSRFTL